LRADNSLQWLHQNTIENLIMPKLKTNKGAAKRFKKTGSGKFKRSSSHLNHILTKKSSKRKRQLRKSSLIAEGDMKSVKKLLPYS